MPKKRPNFVRQWQYETYFLGTFTIELPLDASEEDVEDVRKELDGKYGHDNWKRDSLVRGKKVKAR